MASRLLFRTSILLILIAVFSAIGWAQATSQIQGTVQDSTGAAVPAARARLIIANRAVPPHFFLK